MEGKKEKSKKVDLAQSPISLSDREIVGLVLKGALNNLQKLSEISPHYADIHYRKAEVYRLMAENETDAAVKRAYLQMARKEYQLQTRYNWKGKAAQNARKALSEL